MLSHSTDESYIHFLELTEFWKTVGNILHPQKPRFRIHQAYLHSCLL